MSDSQPLTVGEVLRLSTQFLAERGLKTPRLDAEVLLAFVLGFDRVQIYVNFDRPLDPGETARYRELIRQRARRVPVAHLRGFKEFFGLRFAVSPDVLIPRPETEILVQEVLRWFSALGYAVLPGAWSYGGGAEGAEVPGDAQSAEPVCSATETPAVLDLCTGSGAVAVSLARYLPAAQVVATDLSQAALTVTEANATDLDVRSRLEVRAGDLFDVKPLLTLASFHAITANPPYIPDTVLPELEPDIRYEPRAALDGGPDGLIFYRRLVPGALRYLKTGGLLALEIGHDQAQPVIDMIAGVKGYGAARVVQDYAGKDRVVLAVKEGLAE